MLSCPFIKVSTASESAYISYEHYILNIAFMSALAPAAGQRV